MRERRNLERFNLALAAMIETVTEVGPEEKVVLHLVSGNISSGGAYFPTKQTLPAGREVGIYLFLAPDEANKLGDRGAVLLVKGEVIRSDSDGMAIRFVGRYEIVPMQKLGDITKNPAGETILLDFTLQYPVHFGGPIH